MAQQPKSAGAPWPTRGKRSGGFEWRKPQNTEAADDFERTVDCTESYQDHPSVAAQRQELEELLVRRDNLIEQVKALGLRPEAARIRKQIAVLETALREAGVENI